MLPLRFLLPVILFESVYVLLRPLKVEYVQPPGNQPPWSNNELPDIPAPKTRGECPNRVIIDRAVESANAMLLKMMQVIDTPDVAGHNKMIKAAFGHNPKIDRIKHNIQELTKATIRIRETTHSTQGIFGETKPIPPREGAGGKPEGQGKVDAVSGLVSDRVWFGELWFNNMFTKERALTLIHEAAHFVNHATDDVVVNIDEMSGRVKMKMHPKGKEVPYGATFLEDYAYWEMKEDELLPEILHRSAQFPPALQPYPTTVREVLSNPTWKALVESVDNMEESAEAYW